MSLLNQSKCRAFALSFCRANRPKFRRVSKNFLLRCEARLKGILVSEIHLHPSKGVTLK